MRRKFKDPRIVVSIEQEYSTESLSLGKRTYLKGSIYQVCEAMFEELISAGVATEVDPTENRANGVVVREQVNVVPKVTRWFTANGKDRHDLVEGKAQHVPSNLAAYLMLNGLAEAA